MARIFRAMTNDRGRPLVGTGARTLGVRPGEIPVDAQHMVQPFTGGMSVAPAWRQLPVHRIPPRLGVQGARGNDQDACWRMGDGSFGGGPFVGQLQLTVDTPRHGMLEPAVAMPHADYIQELADTQPAWVIDEI